MELMPDLILHANYLSPLPASDQLSKSQSVKLSKLQTQKNRLYGAVLLKILLSQETVLAVSPRWSPALLARPCGLILEAK